MGNALRVARANKGMVVLILAAVVANVLWWRVVAARTPSARALAEEQSLVGSEAKPIVGRMASGAWTTLDFRSTKTNAILYVVSPECVWCDRNMENARALAAAVEHRYKMVGIVTSNVDASKYARDHGLDFEFVSQISADTKSSYHMAGTPQTIVIRDGRVVANWVGAYAQSRQKEVERFLNVSLPGLIAAEPITEHTPTGCTSEDGGFYSPGAKRTVKGQAFRCDKSGEWLKEALPRTGSGNGPGTFN